MSRIKAYFVFLYHCFLAILNIYLFDCIFSLGFGDSYLAIAPFVIPAAISLFKLGANYFQKQEAQSAFNDATAEAVRLGQDIEKRKFINRYEALQAPLTGTKLQMEQVQRSAQSTTESLQEGGQRASIGGAGRVQQGVTDATAKIAARLDDIQLKLDDKFLSEEQRIGIMNEKKDLQLQYQRLAGAQGAATAAGNQIAENNAAMIGAVGGLVSAGIQGAGLYSDTKKLADAAGLSVKDYKKQLLLDGASGGTSSITKNADGSTTTTSKPLTLRERAEKESRKLTNQAVNNLSRAPEMTADYDLEFDFEEDADYNEFTGTGEAQLSPRTLRKIKRMIERGEI